MSHGQTFFQGFESKGVPRFYGFEKRDLSLTELPLKFALPCLVLDTANQAQRLFERCPDVSDSFQQLPALRCKLGMWGDPVLAVAFSTLPLQGPRREEESGDLAVASRAGGSFLAALAQQLPVLTPFESGKLSDVTLSTGGGQIVSMNGAGRIAAVQDVPVRPVFFECRRITMVAAFASHIIPTVRGEIPFHQVVLTGGVRIGEMAIGAAAALS